MIINKHHRSLPASLPEPANKDEPVENPEWSDVGRNARFPPGWFVAPAFLFPPLLLAALLIYISV